MTLTILDHAIIDTDTLEPTIDPTFAILRLLLNDARRLIYPYHDPARFTTYQISNYLAEYWKDGVARMVAPLHHAQLLPMGRSRDNVEWAVKFYLNNGYIPSIIYPESRFWLPPLYIQLPKVDQAWVEDKPKPKGTKATNKRQCPDCQNWYDLTWEHWHRDPNSLQGWHTICKLCRNDVERRRIEMKRAA